MPGGITALIDLAGGTPVAAEAAALGLTVTGTGFPLEVDDPKSPGDTVLQNSRRQTVLLGFLSDTAQLARDLGAVPGCAPVLLARLALDHWGAETAAKLAGEWLLIDWRPEGVTLIQSAARWVRTYYARRGNRLVIGSDVLGLSRLSWIGREIDDQAFLAKLARGPQPLRTIFANVLELGVGECVRFTAAGTEHSVALPFVPVPQWDGTFAEATEQATRLLGQIVAERLERHGDVACLLSGGLDSSLLTMLVADRLRKGQRAICLTSAAPPGSGLADEMKHAKAVAGALGLDIVPVVPGATPGIYAPGPAEFIESGGPSFSVRHYLYRALADRARGLGLTGLFDGAFGEMTVTGLMPLYSWRWQLRDYAKRLLGRGQIGAASPYRVRLAPHRLVSATLIDETPTFPPTRSRHERWSYFPMVGNIMRSPACLADDIVHEYPFRDQRLLQLFAGFPASFLEQDGLGRAPARAMMAGRLPDAIRLRTGTMPFSPDYNLRLRTEAPAARARIAAFRAADVADWLDLDWLDSTLGRIALHGPRDIDEAFEVQLTAMTAEFVLWWRTGAS